MIRILLVACLVTFSFALFVAKHDQFVAVFEYNKEDRQIKFALWSNFQVPVSAYIRIAKRQQLQTFPNIKRGLFFANSTISKENEHYLFKSELEIHIDGNQHFEAKIEAEGITHVAILQGSQSMVPTNSQCSGIAVFDVRGDTIDFLSRHNCRTATSLSIHGPALVGQDAPVLTVLENMHMFGQIKGQLHQVTTRTIEYIYQEKVYVNLRSLAHPTGEVRGQVASRLYYNTGFCPPHMQRCGDHCYDPVVSTCFAPSLVCSLHEEPCGTRFCYNSANYSCIDGLVCALGQQKCGSICYDSRYFLCEQGELFAVVESYAAQETCGSTICAQRYSCCAETCYDTASYTCMQNTICPKGDSLCPTIVGSVCYNATLQACMKQDRLCTLGDSDCLLCRKGLLACGNRCYDPKHAKCNI